MRSEVFSVYSVVIFRYKFFSLSFNYVCIFNNDTCVYITDLVSQAFTIFHSIYWPMKVLVPKLSFHWFISFKVDEFVPSPFTTYSIQNLLIETKIRFGIQQHLTKTTYIFIPVINKNLQKNVPPSKQIIKLKSPFLTMFPPIEKRSIVLLIIIK